MMMSKELKSPYELEQFARGYAIAEEGEQLSNLFAKGYFTSMSEKEIYAFLLGFETYKNYGFTEDDLREACEDE